MVEHMSRRAKIIWLIAIVGIVFLAYVPSFRGQLVFDDLQDVADNPAIYSFDAMRNALPTTIRPVVYISLWMNYSLAGFDTFGYHVFNFAVHIAAGLTLFGIVSRTLKLPNMSDQYGPAADVIGLFVAGIWLTHPLQTETVTYIIQRSESMMALCYLLCLYCVVRSSVSSRPWVWYLVGISVGWIGIGCKEVMVTAPLVAILYDRVFLADSWKSLWYRRWAIHTGLCAAAVTLMCSTMYRMHGRASASAGFSGSGITSIEYLRSQAGVILHYLRLSILPQDLCLDYAWPVSKTWQGALLPCVVVTVMVAVFLWMLISRRPLGFLGSTFFLVLAPTSSIMPIRDLAVEHRMYLPLAAVVTFLVIAVYCLLKRAGAQRFQFMMAGSLVLGLCLSMLAVRTCCRNTLYIVPAALWENTLRVAPHNQRAYHNLGSYYVNVGCFELGAERLERALEMKPDSTLARSNLAIALDALGRWDESFELSSRVIQENPKSAIGHDLLGRAWLKKGEPRAAVKHAEIAVKLLPTDARITLHLGQAREATGDLTGALACYEKSVALQPNWQEARNSLEAMRAALRARRAGEKNED